MHLLAKPQDRAASRSGLKILLTDIVPKGLGNGMLNVRPISYRFQGRGAFVAGPNPLVGRPSSVHQKVAHTQSGMSRVVRCKPTKIKISPACSGGALRNRKRNPGP